MASEVRLYATNPSSQEQRRHPRVAVELVVRYRPTFVDQWLSGKSVNMSLGGLCIASEVLPAIGTEIAVEIYRGERLFLRATGVVRWIRPDRTVNGDPRGFGLEITSNSEATQARICELIDAHRNGRIPEEKTRRARPLAGGVIRWTRVFGGVVLLAGAVILLTGAYALWSYFQ